MNANFSKYLVFKLIIIGISEIQKHGNIHVCPQGHPKQEQITGFEGIFILISDKHVQNFIKLGYT